MDKCHLKIINRPDIKQAFIIFKDGRRSRLEQKVDNKTGDLSQSLLFEKKLENNYYIQHRMDFGDINENRDPRLDTNIYKKVKNKNKEIKIDFELHRISKRFTDEWIYEWPGINELGITGTAFKIETINQQTITAVACLKNP